MKTLIMRAPNMHWMTALLLTVYFCAGISGLSVLSAQAAEVSRIADILWKPVVGERVSLRGRILRANGQDKYMFADASGDITVVIASALLGGREVSEYATVSIEGSVIKDYRSTPEILVEQVRIDP
jgi:uncharacterized protein (TIGR00156 family)